MSPAVYQLPDDYDSYENFLRVVHDLIKSSSPGYPYCLDAPTIGEWLHWDGIKADRQRLRVLWFETQIALRGEYDAVFKAFIKQEPHKIAKAEAGRWRIIIGFPLPVQVAWQMLFGSGNRAMLENSLDIPTQFGIKLSQGYWRDYYEQWCARGYNAGTDVSAYDFGVTWRKIRDLVLCLRYRLTRGSRKEEWYVTAFRLYEQAYVNSSILFPSGEILRLLLPAVEKSGSPNTIADNSMLRMIESVIVNLMMGVPVHPIGRFVGDDALERIPTNIDEKDYVAAYLKRGWVLKCVEQGLEFVGHLFEARGPQPLYLGKHLWNYFYTPDSILPGYLESMCRLYAKSPHLAFWIRLAENRGLNTFSPSFYRIWYDTDHDELKYLINNLGWEAVRP
nr:RNA-dependent RNA polymerase [Solemoviridae sp.]